VGVDGNTKLLDYAAGTQPIFGFDSERMELLYPEQLPWENPATGNVVLLPGFYGAAVLGLQDALLRMNQDLTHDLFGGGVFQQIPDSLLISPADMNRLAGAGVCVIENYGTGLRVRHAKTMCVSQGPA